MTLTELLQRGRALSEEERKLALRKLLTREEAPALFAWLEDYALRDFVTALGDQNMAPHHGCLEHCAGSIHALQKIRDELVEIQTPPPPRRTAPTS